MNEQPDATGQDDVQTLKFTVRKLAHDFSNSMGILRMAIYYLETAKPEAEKQEMYFSMMSQNLEKMEVILKQLRVVADSPSTGNRSHEVIG